MFASYQSLSTASSVRVGERSNCATSPQVSGSKLHPTSAIESTLIAASDGMHGSNGTITLKKGQEDRIHIDGGNGNVWLGGKHADGDLMLFHRDAAKPRST